MKKALIAFYALLVAGVAMAAITRVSQHSTPGLVAEINTSLGEIDLIAGTAQSQNATNNQAVTLSYGVVEINGIGGANESTNTVTLEAPTAGGKLVTIVVATTSTNLITIADSDPVLASGAILLDAGDTCQFVSTASKKWALIAEHDN